MFDVSTFSVAVTTLLLTVVIRLIIQLWIRDDSKKTGLKHPPSMSALPFVGSLPFFKGGVERLPEYFLKKAEELGPVFTFYAGRNMAIVLNGKTAIVEALRKKSEAFADRPPYWTEENISNLDHKGFGLTKYGDAKKNRKLTMQLMKELGMGVDQEMEIMIWRQLEAMTEEIRKHEGRTFNPKSVMVLSAAGVVTDILFGSKFKSQEKSHREIIEGAREFLENFDTKLNIAPLIRFLPTYRKKIENLVKYQEQTMRGLEEAIKFNKANLSEKTFITRFLVKEGPNYNHQDLLFVLRDVCLGASDTVAVAILWTLVELANHPEIVSRMQKEIDDVIPDNRLPCLEDKPRMPYTEAVIWEVQRRRTLEPLLSRSTLKDTEVCGFMIPKNCMVFPNLYGLHMDPKVWKDPENFRPERFLDENNKIIGKDLIFPFGIGKRSCIGEVIARAQLFLFTSGLFQKFHVRPPEGQNSIKVKELRGIITSPSSYEVRLIPRGKSQ